MPGRQRARIGRPPASAGIPWCLPAVLTVLLLVLSTGLSISLSIVAAPLLPRAAAGEAGSEQFLRIDIHRVTPDIVTTTSDAVVTVAGTIRNVGDRPVRDVVVRLERTDAVQTSRGLRTNLAGNVDQYRPVGDFVTVAGELDQGEEVPFTLSFPLRAGAGTGDLGIAEPGVYPLMVNVNGTPDYGVPARLDDARFLLPVLGVPPDTRAGSTAEELSSLVLPDTSRPVALTVFWPLADRPRLAAGVPGGTTPVRLVDDELAAELAPGGRLEALLAAVESATGPALDPDGDLARAVCLAVDPDLLVTVNAMTAGYVVNDGPDLGTATPTRPGTGQDAATAWLDRLRALAQRLCVTPTVYAQADLDAVARIGDPGLAAAATTAGADIVDRILGVSATRGVTLLGDGPLTAAAVTLLAGQGETVVVAPAALAADDTATADLTPVRYGPRIVAAPFDPAVSAALAAAGASPATPAYLDDSLTIPLRRDSAVARRESALGAVLWRALHPDTEPRSQIVVPPPTWSPRPDDARAVLTAAASAIRAGLATPRPVPVLVGQARTVGATDRSADPGRAADPGRIDDDIVSGMAAAVGRIWGLTAALGEDVRTGLTGMQYTAPLREDLLRGLSQAVPPADRNDAAGRRLDRVTRTVDDLFRGVTVIDPGGSYTLATERSPLPLALRNDLPLPIRVRLGIDAPPGMEVTDLGVIELPPGYLPVRVPIEVHFTQRVAVDVGLRTADGLPLGEPVRLSVHSNAYGKWLFILTLSAGAVLVLLAGRRLWHRFRGQPDRADLDRPDPLEVALHYRPEDDRPDPDRPGTPPAGRTADPDRGGRP